MDCVYENKYNCCGCTACANICPRKAIEMNWDDKGFYYPHINIAKCVSCGLCRKVCDFSNFNKTESGFIKSFAVRHKCESEVITSQSGGVSSALMQAVIDKNGVCYGASLTSDLQVCHKKADSKAECSSFKGSKYVQSRIDNGIFKECKEFLDSGRMVLFSGTGCQVHGLLRYLAITNTDCTNLVTVDFVCHGVPSPGVWEIYINLIQQHQKILHVDFRNKEKFGWNSHVQTYTFSDGTQESNSRWADVFYQNCMFREACYECPYTTPYRNSDFTIGDYWGFEKVIDGYRDNKGLSLVIAHSQRAVNMLQELKDCLFIYETDLSQSLQPQLQKPVYKGIEYNRFWKMYLANNKKAIKVFFFPRMIRRVYMFALKRLKKRAKGLLKKCRVTLRRGKQ